MFWSARVSSGNYFQMEISRYSKGKLEKIAWYPQRGLTNFHLDVKQTEKQEPGLNSSGLCWFDLRGEEMLTTPLSGPWCESVQKECVEYLEVF